MGGTPYVARPLPQKDPSLDVSQNHYWRYHRLEPLLAAKQPVTDSVDEDLFIAVHQTCEIAFHQMVLDLGRTLYALRLAFAAGDPSAMSPKRVISCAALYISGMSSTGPCRSSTACAALPSSAPASAPARASSPGSSAISRS